MGHHYQLGCIYSDVFSNAQKTPDLLRVVETHCKRTSHLCCHYGTASVMQIWFGALLEAAQLLTTQLWLADDKWATKNTHWKESNTPQAKRFLSYFGAFLHIGQPTQVNGLPYGWPMSDASGISVSAKQGVNGMCLGGEFLDSKDELGGEVPANPPQKYVFWIA